MLKLSTCLVIWILMLLLLDAVVTENPQEKKTSRSLGRNDSIGLTSLNEIPRLEGELIVKREYEHAMKSKNERTLLDYNGPPITELSDIRNDQVFANHVRVKRSKFMNYSLPHFLSKNDTIYASDELLSRFDGSYVNSNRIESDTLSTTTRTYSRYKRRVLSKNRQRRKRVKGNIRHPKHSIEAEIGGQVSKNTAINMRTKKTDKSQLQTKMKKRESENSSRTGDVGADSTDCEKTRANKSETLVNQSNLVLTIDNSKPEGQQEANSIVLPFLHTGKAELRVRIEKIATDKSSLINPDNWTDHSTTTDPSSAMSTQSKYRIIDEIINTNVTNSKPISNCNYTEGERQEVDNPIEMISSAIKADRNLEDRKYKRTNRKFAESADEDMKYRAKRNEEIMSKRYLSSDTRAIGLKHLKNTGQTIRGVKHKRMMEKNGRTRGNRAVRSIEEIKDLVEKLVAKVNELQTYVSNYSEAPNTTDPCVSEKADRAPRLSENLNYKTEFARDTDHERLRSNRQAIAVEKRAFQMPSSVSRVTRANRGRRRLLRKWNRWTDWSSCSVTCGKGRQIRWRHCLRDCDDAEIEMEEKACQLPACPPGKFLGIF